jgi:hypothetical protein
LATPATVDEGVLNSYKRENRVVEARKIAQCRIEWQPWSEVAATGGATPGIDSRDCPLQLTNSRTDQALVKSGAQSETSGCLQDVPIGFPGI